MTHGDSFGSPTRGFLFADLRGYTAFLERAGAHRAAAMLGRYRELVRGEVARFHGAEIRTEGDSFYVVFDRASAAIECGLAIVTAAVAASETDRELPISVGIGVHAGETVETAEGYVGTAVNIAARVCALAPSNQVLVTDTVRALTAGVVPAEFVPFGSRRLKGLAQPIALHRALPAGSALPGRRRRVPVVAIGFLGIVVVVAVGAWLVSGSGLLGSRPRASEPGRVSPTAANPSVAAGASASASASVEPSLGVFPTNAETALLDILSPRRTDPCERMDQADAPRHFRPDSGGIVRPHEIAFVAGVDCALGGISGPDRAWLWHLPPLPLGGSSLAPAPDEVLSLQGSRIDAASGGTCATEVPALERWEFGTHEGLLLCYQSATGDAVVMWTYDDATLVGKAINDEQNMAALLTWWAEVARFGPS